MVALAVAALGGCSNDVGRFGDGPVYTGSTPNQREILGAAPAARRPAYPQSGYNVDTTGSIGGADPMVSRQDLAPPMAPAAPVVQQSYAATPATQPYYEAPAAPSVPQAPRVAAAGGWTATGGSYVTLQPGETVDTLSRRYGVPSGAIVQANNFSATNRPLPGGRVLIPVYAANAPAAAPVAAQPAPVVRQIPIARPLGAPPQTLAVPRTAVAPAPAPMVMASRPPVAAAPAPLPVAAPHPVPVAPVAQAPRPDPAGGVKLVGDYTVRPGDTLSSVARTYGVSEQALKERNNLRQSSLTPGQHLLLPAGTKLMLKTSQAPAHAAEAAAPLVAQAPVAKPGAPTKVAAAPVPPVTTASLGPKPGTTSPAVGAALSAAQAARNEKIDQKAAETVAVAKETAAEEPASSASAAAGSFRWPVRGRVISEFGAKPNGEKNEGINLAVPEGTSVKAADDGEVIYSGNELKGYGNLVLVRHANGFVSAYAHASELLVNRGEKVSRGQIIARAGATGSVTQPQLHFELRKGQKAIDPKPYLASN
ncbi:LysM peptidoglycan-binding domain-containing M23 family metallopeptidase [Siculibacillus lacustris]|nr:LysM peptidoglycan-binding domain-containing M23 family metallopeptidase [Siculibacillus lacustris]